MSRDENTDTSTLNLPDPVITECVYYTEKSGVLDNKKYEELIEMCKAQHLKLPIICAKSILNTDTKINTYFILCAGSIMFDPRNVDTRYRSRNRWKLRRVKKSVYDLYVKFLNTKHNTYLFQAEREI